MNYTPIFCVLLSSLVSCNEIESEKKAFEVSKGINEINQSIEDNIKNAKELNNDQEITRNLDGPYPADEYKIKPTGKFYFLAVYPHKNDSIWITFSSKTEEDILGKYTKLKVFKVRPTFVSRDNWMKIRQGCIEQNMIFDISDVPKGWLLENEKYLK